MWGFWLRFVLRPLGRLLGSDRWEPHVAGRCACVNCGYQCVVVINAASPCYNADTGVLDLLECGECGKYTLCSE